MNHLRRWLGNRCQVRDNILKWNKLNKAKLNSALFYVRTKNHIERHWISAKPIRKISLFHLFSIPCGRYVVLYTNIWNLFWPRLQNVCWTWTNKIRGIFCGKMCHTHSKRTFVSYKWSRSHNSWTDLCWIHKSPQFGWQIWCAEYSTRICIQAIN